MRLARYIASALLAVAPAVHGQNISGRGGAAFTHTPVAMEPGSNVAIRISTPLSVRPMYGFMPVLLTVQNASARDGTWHFAFYGGNLNGVAGALESGIDVAVGAGQNKEVWYFVPLPSAGVDASQNAVGGLAGSGVLPAEPPAIAGVYPAPAGVTSSWRMRTQLDSPNGGFNLGTARRTFTITQTGPAAALPDILNPELPALTSLVVDRVPEADGTRVRRTSVVTVEAPFGAGAAGGRGAVSPMSILSAATRTRLETAGVLVRGVGVSSSTSAAPAGVPGMTTVTFRYQQNGPAERLAVPGGVVLPPGVEVEVLPGASPGEVVRTVIFRETVPTATIAPAGARAGLGGGRLANSPAGAEAAARQALASTRLLEPRAGVTEAPVQNTMVNSSPAGQVFLTLFIQTGPRALLPRPAASTLPAGAIVNLHPGPSADQVVRTISYVDASTIVQLSGMPAGTAGRYELMRRGFLRNQTGVAISNTTRTAASAAPGSPVPSVSSSSSPGVLLASGLAVGSASPGTTIWSESGPAALLPDVAADMLPANTTVTVTPGAMPGEVTRNFIIAGNPVVTTAAAGTGIISSASISTPHLSVVQAAVSGPGVSANQNHGSVRSLGSGRILLSGMNNPGSTPPIAVTPALETDLRTKLNGLGLRGGSASLTVIDPDDVPADWRTWSSFHGVVIPAAEYEALNPTRRTALLGWVAMGGNLFIEPADEQDGDESAVGAGRIYRLSTPIRDSDLGQLVIDLRLGDPALALPQNSQLTFPARSPLAVLTAESGFNAKSLAIFLGLFAVVVGPVNLYLFAPAAKRHRLFFTTPLIAVAGSAVLAGSILFADGLGGSGNRATLVVIVPGENQAAVFQEQAVQTGVLTSRSFALDDSTLLSTLPIEGYTINRKGSEMSRLEGQAAGDWFRARWQHVHLLRRFAPTRGRVEIAGTSPTGAPIVESTVSTTLAKFSLVGGDGRIWVAEEVPTGRRVTLAPSPNDQWPRLRTDGSAHLEAVFRAAARREPGRWTATGGATEIAPVATLTSIDWTDSPVVYAGLAPTRAPGVAAR